MEQTHGIVGIFDALGARNFSAERVDGFIGSRQEILQEVRKVFSQQAASRQLCAPLVLTFNDTIVIALAVAANNEYHAIKGFAKVVRRLIYYGLTKGVFFRGAFSIGTYIAKEDEHFVMGSAVTDAASWYEQPEFIGAVATPKASMIIHKYVLQDPTPPDFVLFERELPCKAGARLLYTVNWPKAFYVAGLRPRGCLPGQEQAYLLGLLSANEVPFRTEGKYRNTIAFFEGAPKDESHPGTDTTE